MTVLGDTVKECGSSMRERRIQIGYGPVYGVISYYYFRDPLFHIISPGTREKLDCSVYLRGESIFAGSIKVPVVEEWEIQKRLILR